MSHRRWVASIVVLGCAASALASQFQDADSIQLDQTIDSLSSTNWRQRHEAVERLVRIGPPAQQRLEELIESPADPETRLRAQEALRQILPQRRIEPALITRDFVDANVAEAFNRVAEIEGGSLRCEPPNLIRNIRHPITAHYQHELYWNVVLDLCRKSGLRLRCDERGVTIIKAGPRAKFDRFCVSGVLLITMPQTILAHEGPHLAVFAEPRARLVHAELPKLDGASIGIGESLTNGYWWPAKRSQSMSLHGSVNVLLVESEQKLEAPGNAARTGLGGPLPISFSTGGVSATVLRAVHAQVGYQIDIQISVDPADVDWDALLFSTRTGGLRVYDVDDREMPFVRLSCDGRGPTNVAQLIVSPLPNSPNRPYKLVWDVPAKTVSITLPFTLDRPTSR